MIRLYFTWVGFWQLYSTLARESKQLSGRTQKPEAWTIGPMVGYEIRLGKC
jgi:hypothetical protein